MELRDLIVTPIVIILICAAAYKLRPYVTDSVNRSYFLPALTVRILGSLVLGFVYQFYYDGGDTFNYHTHGSRIIWNAFIDSPSLGLKLLLSDGSDSQGIYDYASRIYFFRDDSSYFVIRIAALLDLLTFSSYSATGVLFSVISFTGAWLLFLTFYKQYPHLHFGIACATLFIPSVFFWGSGLLKDTLIVGSLGVVTHQLHKAFIERKLTAGTIFILSLCLYLIYNVKIFILQAFIPAAIVWIAVYHFDTIRSRVLRFMLIPLIVVVVLYSSYYSIERIGSAESKYAVANLIETARVTAYDIRFWTGRAAGSGYTLEVMEWTPIGILQSAPSAINVSLFRPYLWEVKNPLMLISSLESTVLLVFSIYVFLGKLGHSFSSFRNHNVLFSIVFSISFAFAVGISTFNFGTLTRYRIPLLPFYLLALVLINDHSNKEKKVSTLAATE